MTQLVGHHLQYHEQLSTVTSKTSMNNLAKKYPNHIIELDEHDPEYQIWKSAWQAAHNMFGTEDGFPVLRMKVPNRGLKRVLVRPECVQAYNDAQLVYTDTLMKRKVRSFDTPDDPPLAAPNGLLSTSEPSAASGLDTCNSPPPTQRACRYALIVAGQPGIGKTIFLWYVLVRRLVIQEPVIYQDLPDTFFIFHEHGVAKVVLSPILSPRDLREVLPLSTWCLIDSSQHLVEPAPIVLELQRFTIQAESPSGLTKDWHKKMPSSLYIMKPPSLRELELFQGCFEDPSNSLEDIRRFYALCGPSTWRVLIPSSSALFWESEVKSALRLLASSGVLLADVMRDLTDLIDHHPGISSIILLLKPGPKRHMGRVEFVSEYVCGLVIDWACKKSRPQARALYNWLLNGFPAAKAIAGRLLEDYVHSMLLAGGEFNVTTLSFDELSQTWTERHSDMHATLAFPIEDETFAFNEGGDGAFVGRMSEDYIAHDNSKILSQQDYSFDPQNLPPMDDFTYYKCTSKEKALFDSFLYSGSGQCIVAFKVLTSTEHDIRLSDIEWLKRVTWDVSESVGLSPSFCLVGISTKNILTFACKDGAGKLVDLFCHMKLDGFSDQH